MPAIAAPAGSAGFIGRTWSVRVALMTPTRPSVKNPVDDDAQTMGGWLVDHALKEIMDASPSSPDLRQHHRDARALPGSRWRRLRGGDIARQQRWFRAAPNQR